MNRAWGMIGALVAVGFLAGPATGATDAEKCEAAKLKIAGKYGFCRLKADAKAVKTGDPADYSKCDGTFAVKWGTAETNGGGRCPTNGDQLGIQNQMIVAADVIAAQLSGVRFVDNGDGTVTDTQTGLMWEKKDDLGGIHDKDNWYTWSTGFNLSGPPYYPPDGTAFTTFLGTLNYGTSTDGATISGCFANHCDWQLPTIAELKTILLAAYPCGTSPCIDPIFGPTPFGTAASSDYWSATSFPPEDDVYAWLVDFNDGRVTNYFKDTNLYVRAVRSGS